MPSGPKLRISTTGPWLRAVPAGGKNIDAAKSLIEALMGKDMLSKYYPDAIWGPVLQEHLAFDAFKDPVHAGLADLSVNGTAPAFPDVNNAAFAEFNANFLVPKMIQRVVIDKISIDQAIDEAQKAGDAIYAKYP
jgi:multiple sugar transport system substrate-binding protein